MGSHTLKIQSFIHMLKTVRDIPNKQYSTTGLNAEKNQIIDIFIRMFIEETTLLVKRGLKADYREQQGNERFYKGKFLVAQHIKHNAAHRERFYIEYDEYSIDRPENRLIKSTIELLLKVSINTDHQKDLYLLLAAFDNVAGSAQPELDFERVSADRTMKEYQTILEWCRIFLSGQSFTPFRGDSRAYALLFQMEKVFERYVAVLLKKLLAHANIRVKTQDRTYHLFQNPKKFQLKPDIVVQGPSGAVVLDTKWKLLSSSPDYGISQADMYQAYAYGKKYGSGSVYLLYPWTPSIIGVRQPITFNSGDGVEIRIFCLDLSLGNKCMDVLAEEILAAVV